jgi:hypothetical protein
MSNGTRDGIQIQPAHDALQKLLDDIEKVGVDNLPSKPASSIKDARTWVRTLESTRKVLREWCDGFVLEVQSRR